MIEEEQEVIVRTRVVRFVGSDRTTSMGRGETPMRKETDVAVSQVCHAGQDAAVLDIEMKPVGE